MKKIREKNRCATCFCAFYDEVLGESRWLLVGLDSFGAIFPRRRGEVKRQVLLVIFLKTCKADHWSVEGCLLLDIAARGTPHTTIFARRVVGKTFDFFLELVGLWLIALSATTFKEMETKSIGGSAGKLNFSLSLKICKKISLDKSCQEL